MVGERLLWYIQVEREGLRLMVYMPCLLFWGV